MAIEPIEGKVALVCQEDMTGMRIHSEAGLLARSAGGKLDANKVTTEIASVCTEVWTYLEEQFNDLWVGVYRAVLNADTSHFSIATHFNVTLFLGYSNTDLEDMCDGVEELLTSLQDFILFPLLLDFRLQKRSHA